MEDLSKLSLVEQINGLKLKKFSSMELTEFYLNKIDQEKVLNSFISLNENALTEAKKSDEKIAKNKSSSLEGIPIAHKDIFCIKELLAVPKCLKTLYLHIHLLFMKNYQIQVLSI